MVILLLWTLGGAPTMTAPITTRRPDGSWECSAFCLTAGNQDGGMCRTPVHAKKDSEAACRAALEAKCAKVKPPPGGCRWQNSPPASR